jgi:hypothetical protein
MALRGTCPLFLVSPGVISLPYFDKIQNIGAIVRPGLFGKQGSGGVIVNKLGTTAMAGMLGNMRRSGFSENSPEWE